MNLFLLVSSSVVKVGGEGDKIPFKFSPSRTVQRKAIIRPLWRRIETRHTVIQYESLKDIKKFDGKIDYSPGDWSVKSLFSAADPNDPMGSIIRKMDALYERVQEILDMRGRMKKVVINLYSGKRRLHEAYHRLTGTKCRIRAWYIYESNTIFINVDDVHKGILAHEMAHAIVDHYFSVRPPRATAEILARYVDKHLIY